MPASLASRINQACRLRGSFTLRSGQISQDYFDKYLFEAEPALLSEVCSGMSELVPSDTEVLAGMELGGIPIATVISQLTGLPTAFVRKQAKGYGTNKIVEGSAVEGRRVVMVEDVVTTGGALLRSASDLRAAGATLQTVVCGIDRQQGGTENLRAAGLSLRALLTRSDLERG